MSLTQKHGQKDFTKNLEQAVRKNLMIRAYNF